MSIGGTFRGALIQISVAVGANANIAAAGAAPIESGAARFAVSLEAPPSFGPIARSPLLDIYFAPRGSAIGWLDPGAFAPLTSQVAGAPGAGLTSADEQPALPQPSAAAPPAAEPPLPPVLTRSASPEPDPAPTALAAALARLIVGESANPLGAGDWRSARAAIGAFYAGRGFQPVWVDGDGFTPAGRRALAQLARAAEDGLDLSGLALPHNPGARIDPTELASAETAIAVAVVTYAEQASGSRIAPSRVSPLFDTVPSVADPGEALAETAGARDPGARLAAFNPPQKGYRALREELKRLESAPALRPPALALKLDAAGVALAGDDPAPAANPPNDRRSGRKGRPRHLLYTASVDPARVSSLARRRAAILANMEMWRWEPRNMGERRIEVNIPDFSIEVFDRDAMVHSARVIVGKPATPTPIFSNVMRYVLVNPSWQVPDSIIKKEILPRTQPLHQPRL